MVGASTCLSLLAITGLASAAATARPRWKGEVIRSGGTTYECKCYSDNACWPSPNQWKALNATVGGTLQVALPPAAVCYNKVGNLSTYNAAQCAEVTAKWADEQFIVDTQVGNLWPLYTNNTCLPSSDPSKTCTKGFYPEYVIMATKKEHIKAGVDFARENNLRLLIRNTGHDFMGRSAGWGSLAINTHSFRSTEFNKKYSGPGGYTGAYATLGSGVQARDIYKKAFEQTPKQVIVGGECPTVGYAGGYLQGGGHGPLAGIYGMAADQVLSFDVITADGKYRTANAAENPDLYWALKGGGPSTFAAVVSVTVKTFPEVKAAAAILNINSTLQATDDQMWDAFKKFHSMSNTFADNGMFVYFEIQPGRFHIQPFVGPRMDAAKLNSFIKPLKDYLDAKKIPYDTVTKEFPTFWEMYIDMFEDEFAGGNAAVGGRLFTTRDIAEHNDAIVESYKIAVKPTEKFMGFTIGHMVNPGYGNPNADNPINSKWRNASSFVINNVLLNGDESWAVRQEAADVVTNVVDEAMRKAAPYSGAYVNEGDINEPNWQSEYWGEKYPRLLKIKQKYDPNGVFYAQTTPGTEDWEVINYGTKLCKKV
ncbi:FAD-binding domain-containing protein, partial [Delitschia confertaspora ATCC 74209]